MTNKDRILLLKDLCAKLPYGVKVVYLATTYSIQYVDSKFDEVKLEGMPHTVDIGYIKPYLRSMLSMTEDERKEVENLIKENRPNPYGIINNKGIDNLLFSVSVTSGVLTNWLNFHYFDYQGLIEKGLALEVTKENNPYK